MSDLGNTLKKLHALWYLFPKNNVYVFKSVLSLDGIADKKWNEVWEKTIEVPTGRFETDEHTMALWHFDWEGDPGSKWRDASGNGHHLTYTGTYLHVNPHGTLATTWADLRRR